MASLARIGWGGAFFLSTNLTTLGLVEMVEVTSFGLPDEVVDEVEVTHLKSPDRRKEFISGLSDGGTVEVTLNYVAGSATDLAIRNAKASGSTRAIRFVLADQAGAAAWNIDTFGFVQGYARGPVSAGDKMESTVRIRVTGAQTEAVAA